MATQINEEISHEINGNIEKVRMFGFQYLPHNVYSVMSFTDTRGYWCSTN